MTTAAVTVSKKTILFQERPTPETSPGSARIAMSAVTLCGTDAHIWDDDYASELPIIQGHEAAGIIVDIHPTDEGNGFKIGDRVVICPMFYCGTCYACSIGRVNACKEMSVYGCYEDGSLVDEQVVPFANLFKIPDSLPIDLAPLVEPISIAMQACKRGRPVQGEKVLVNGAGPIGVLAVRYLKDQGCDVAVSDMVQSRLDLAVHCGADKTFLVPDGTQDTQIAQWTDGNGPSLIIDATGSPASLASAIDQVATAGRVVCVGISDRELVFDMRTLVSKEIDLLGSRNSQNLFPECIELLDKHQNTLRALITHRFEFADLDQAFTTLTTPDAGVGKIAIDFPTTQPGAHHV
ncbi:Zn-dependent alcohol dehydrogenase [Corynebacterium suranareeae]|uniref:Zn-dependent alcohol dehydrogenase n=1 Tax=Corynebacterium suranareeae TaxID=2506452 RepID=A0A160PVX8_9CORY|nr:alcohol dehydrogenase catalytic domain-containing protein [Corynebacterium suranareeae]BAU96960.1 Zn-dependent alcohol dehydrogenase [Corynebacterium suranareeae]